MLIINNIMFVQIFAMSCRAESFKTLTMYMSCTINTLQRIALRDLNEENLRNLHEIASTSSLMKFESVEGSLQVENRF